MQMKTCYKTAVTAMLPKSQGFDLLFCEVVVEKVKLYKVLFLSPNFTQTVDVYKECTGLMLPWRQTQRNQTNNSRHEKGKGSAHLVLLRGQTSRNSLHKTTLKQVQRTEHERKCPQI